MDKVQDRLSGAAAGRGGGFRVLCFSRSACGRRLSSGAGRPSGESRRSRPARCHRGPPVCGWPSPSTGGARSPGGRRTSPVRAPGASRRGGGSLGPRWRNCLTRRPRSTRNSRKWASQNGSTRTPLLRSVSGAGEIASRTMWRAPLAPPAGVPDSHEIAGGGFEQKTPQRPINTPRGVHARLCGPDHAAQGAFLAPYPPWGGLGATRPRDPPALATVGPGRRG